MRFVLGTIFVLVMAAATDRRAHAADDAIRTLGFAGGAFRLGQDGESGGMGFEAGYGRRLGPVHLFAQYAFLVAMGPTNATDSSNHGSLQRLGLAVRYKAAGVHIDRGEIAFWLEGGMGREYPLLDHGPNEARSDVLFGVGLEVRGKVHGERGAGGWMGIRSILTDMGTAGVGPATCAGPCDVATTQRRYGAGIMLVLGVTWGR